MYVCAFVSLVPGDGRLKEDGDVVGVLNMADLDPGSGI